MLFIENSIILYLKINKKPSKILEGFYFKVVGMGSVTRTVSSPISKAWGLSPKP